MSTQPIYFGTGPWPCLNPTCGFFRQFIIVTCQIHFSSDSRRPVGTFACGCGFTYNRLGPDKTIDDCYRFSRVETYGTVWENRLRQVWLDPETSLRGVARQLGVDPRTASRHAARLGLHIPRVGHRHGKKPVIVEKNKQPESEETCLRHRQRWLSLLDRYPEHGVNDLRAHDQSTFSWLYRNDRHWLNQHKPLIKPPEVSLAGRVDWAKRDIILAEACLSVALLLAKRPGKPKKLTQTAIIRETGHCAVVFQHPEKLPLTIEVLSQLAESRQDYALRRIEWVATRFQIEGTTLKKWQLTKLSGTGRVKAWHAIEQALELFTQWLQKSSLQREPDCPPMEVSQKLIYKISEQLRQFLNNNELNYRN